MPPQMMIPDSMISELISGGVISKQSVMSSINGLMQEAMTCFISTVEITTLEGREETKSLPETSSNLFSGNCSTEPIFILMYSLVFSPMIRWCFFLKCLVIASSTFFPEKEDVFEINSLVPEVTQMSEHPPPNVTTRFHLEEMSPLSQPKRAR